MIVVVAPVSMLPCGDERGLDAEGAVDRARRRFDVVQRLGVRIGRRAAGGGERGEEGEPLHLGLDGEAAGVVPAAGAGPLAPLASGVAVGGCGTVAAAAAARAGSDGASAAAAGAASSGARSQRSICPEPDRVVADAVELAALVVLPDVDLAVLARRALEARQLVVLVELPDVGRAVEVRVELLAHHLVVLAVDPHIDACRRSRGRTPRWRRCRCSRSRRQMSFLPSKLRSTSLQVSDLELGAVLDDGGVELPDVGLAVAVEVDGGDLLARAVAAALVLGSPAPGWSALAAVVPSCLVSVDAPHRRRATGRKAAQASRTSHAGSVRRGLSPGK